MDEGPGTTLGALGWFVGVWVVMMAAMMLPSAAPTVALYARMTRSGPGRAARVHRRLPADLAAAGLLAYALVVSAASCSASELAWDGAGRWVAGGTLRRRGRLRAHAAQGRVPVQVPQPARLPGRLLARRAARARCAMGVRHGAWCSGCCWALMASLFALGVMSLGGMAFVAALIAFEKTVPWERAATWTTAGVLVVLGVLLIAAPDVIPGLRPIPGEGMGMP